MKNLSAADELALVRQEIRHLQSREKALRDVVLADPEARKGSTHHALIVIASRRNFDLAGLRMAYPEIAEEFTSEVSVTVVKTVETEGE